MALVADECYIGRKINANEITFGAIHRQHTHTFTCTDLFSKNIFFYYLTNGFCNIFFFLFRYKLFTIFNLNVSRFDGTTSNCVRTTDTHTCAHSHPYANETSKRHKLPKQSKASQTYVRQKLAISTSATRK